VAQALEETAAQAQPPGARSDSPPADAAMPADEGPPLTVENRGGQFIIDLRHPSRIEMLAELRAVVQGLLFVKPLTVRFQFGTSRSCHPELAAALATLIGSIRDAGGTVAVAAGHEQLANELRRILPVPIEVQ